MMMQKKERNILYTKPEINQELFSDLPNQMSNAFSECTSVCGERIFGKIDVIMRTKYARNANQLTLTEKH